MSRLRALLRGLHGLARGGVIVLSMTAAAACGQGYGLTLSTCAHVNARAGSRRWAAVERVIDAVFFLDPGHCAGAWEAWARHEPWPPAARAALDKRL